MKKLVVGLLGTGVLAVACTLGISHYIGGQLQTAMEDAVASWNGEGFNVELLSYDRGLLGAEAQTVWTFATEDASYEMLATHSVHHGPWSGGHAGTIDTQFHLPDNSEAALIDALQDRPLLQWHTTVFWQGGTDHHLQSPAFQATFDDASALNWGGLEARMTLPAARDQTRGWLRAPALHVQSADQSALDLADLAFDFDVQLVEGSSLWAGPVQLQMGTLRVRDAAQGESLHLENLRTALHNTVTDGLAALQLTAQAKALQTASYAAHDVDLALHAERVDAQWLGDWWTWLQGDLSDPEHLAVLQHNLPQLLAHHPVVTLEKLALRTADGNSHMESRWAYVGQDPQSPNLLTDLHASVHAAMPKRLLENWLGQQVRSDYVELLAQMEQTLDDTALQASVEDGVRKRLAVLIEAGLLHDEQEALSIDLKLDRGALQLNGQAIDWQTLLGIGQSL